MANWNNPTETSDYQDFPDEVRDVAKSAAKMNYVSDGDTNLFDGMMQYDRSSKKWQQRESGVWVDKELTNLADDSVDTGAIQDNAVTTVKILDSNITTAKIADLNVTTGKLANDAVTEAKLDPDAATRSTLLASFQRRQSEVTVSLAATFRGTFDAIYTPPTKATLPKAGKITHITINTFADVLSGTIEAILGRNGSSTGKSVTLSAGGGTGGAITAESFSINDYIEIAITTASPVFSGANDTLVMVEVWGHFTS